ncbi:alpha/beta hydrolase [Streptomyces europaeiscabiei]|uniref:alpha/beta fold hydrolase n=1 Tax=Streptomyces europaeiscabiei TaxID=146819 RepID=UPI002E1620CE|nr:alpha/beta hydrolase [Streptomyces europaeiscabiei]
MPRIMVGTENSAEVSLYYEDFGTGDPVVLIHGWPLTQDSWELQVGAFVEAGHRVITYDRRGSGRSTRTWTGYDYDTLATDLHALVEHLDLAAWSLVGFSSGSGDATRYVANHGTHRISKLVLASPILIGGPTRAGTVAASGGEMTADLLAAARRHRVPMLDDLLTRFFSVNGYNVLDEPTRLYHLHTAASASPKGAADSISALPTANRPEDLARVDVPALVVHGEDDAFMPYETSGRSVARAIPDSRTVTIPNAPHAAPLTHPQQWNEAVLAFLAG